MALSAKEREIIKEAVEIIQRETAENGGRMIIRGFGTFKRELRAAREGRNPATGKAIQIPEKSVLKFSASKSTSF